MARVPSFFLKGHGRAFSEDAEAEIPARVSTSWPRQLLSCPLSGLSLPSFGDQAPWHPALRGNRGCTALCQVPGGAPSLAGKGLTEVPSWEAGCLRALPPGR